MPGDSADPSLMGDEPAMMVGSGLDIPVAVCAERSLGAKALEESGECDVLVLDDGFAHRALMRHVDILVLRSEAPFGSGHLLPAGTLREAPSGLGRAQVLWFHDKRGRRDEVGEAQAIGLAPNAQVIRSEGAMLGAHNGRGDPCKLDGIRVIAAAGIARPADLLYTLKKAGLDVAELMTYPDHHVFDSSDVAAIQATRERLGADAVVVTAKDGVKLSKLWESEPERWLVLHYGVRITEGEDVLGELLKRSA